MTKVQVEGEQFWVHRKCRNYLYLESSDKIVLRKEDSSKEIFCELCWQGEGKHMKCMVPECNKYSHLLCASIKERIVEEEGIPVSIYLIVELFMFQALKTPKIHSKNGRPQCFGIDYSKIIGEIRRLNKIYIFIRQKFAQRKSGKSKLLSYVRN